MLALALALVLVVEVVDGHGVYLDPNYYNYCTLYQLDEEWHRRGSEEVWKWELLEMHVSV